MCINTNKNGSFINVNLSNFEYLVYNDSIHISKGGLWGEWR